MAHETSKALRRRMIEDAKGIFPWRSILSGRGIDVGCGPAKLPYAECRGFDLEDGDANQLHKYFEPESFDYIHSSQSLEHMRSPDVVYDSWLRVLKPGGFIIITVPSWELYEGMRWPSVYNPDHKSTWSMNLKGSPAGVNHVHVPSWLERNIHRARPLLMRQLAENYNYTVGVADDQTWEENDAVEPWIEIVLQKPGGVGQLHFISEKQYFANTRAAKTFAHCGDLGDIIAALPIIRQLGGGHLYITDYKADYGQDLVKSMHDRHQLITPLLANVPYITGVEYVKELPPGIDYDLTKFRVVHKLNRTLTESQAAYLHLRNIDMAPWISVPPFELPPRTICVSRSARYHHDAFPWREIAARHHLRMHFVGLRNEHKAFCEYVQQNVTYVETGTLLDVARVIAGSEIFIGNQSSPCWIAMAMGHKLIQEVCAYTQDSMVVRPNARFIFNTPIDLNSI